MEFDSVKTGSLLNQSEKRNDTLNFLVISDHLICQQLSFLHTSTFPSLTF